MSEAGHKIKTYFIRGIAFLFPLFLTILVLKWLVGTINFWFLEPFVKFLRPYIDSVILVFFTKITLFILLLLLVVLCGIIVTKALAARRFFGVGEYLLMKTPIVSKIYTTMKEISSALFIHKKGIFRRVVFIQYPRPGLYSVGFLTCEHVDRHFIKREVNDDLAIVFIASTPNPTTGFLVLVEKSDLIDTDMTVEDAIKLILSGGAINPYSRSKLP